MPKYLSIRSTYHVILLVLLFRWKTSENTIPCCRNELDKVETEKGTTKTKQKKNFIDPFNRLELANQVSILRLTPHERDWGSSSYDLMKVACAKTNVTYSP